MAIAVTAVLVMAVFADNTVVSQSKARADATGRIWRRTGQDAGMQVAFTWGKQVLNLFRAASLAEGLSFLVILSVSLGLISRDYVFMIGMTHGVLFLVYMVLSLWVSNSRNWSVMVWLLIFLAAVVPFAFIGVELFLRREEQKGLQQADPA